MTPLITIENWDRGMVSSPFQNIQGSGQLFQSLDPWTEPGYLQSADATTKDSGSTVDGLVNFALEYDGDLFFYGTKLYRRTGSDWTVEGTDSQTGPGLGLGQLYDNADSKTYIYFASQADIGRYDPVADAFDDDWLTDVKGGTIDSDAAYHPMQLWDNTLFIGAGRYIASLTSGATYTARALTLPANLRVTSLAVIGDMLAIGTTAVPNSSNVLSRKSPVFFWDGTSAQFNKMLTVNERYIKALFVDENFLYAFAQTRGGTIYVYNGIRFEILRHMPNPGQDVINFYPGGVTRHRDGIHFAVSHGDTAGEIKAGIWSLSRKRAGEPLALEFKHVISTTRTDNTITLGAIIDGNNGLFVGWKDTTDSTTYGVDDQSGLATGYFESQLFSFNNSNKIDFKGVEIEAKTLPSSTTIAINYKIDNDSSWTTAITYKPANQTDFAPINRSGRKIQIQAVLTPSGSSNVSLQKIMVF
jgi:hypothetical protein